MFKSKTSGYIMSVIGFLFILYSAVNYIFGLHLTTPSAAIGIVLVAVGTAIIKKYRNQSTETENRKGNQP
jgi:mannose/fructose/N-acetylgalactosamine-specific phosphotransferase system component IIC